MRFVFLPIAFFVSITSVFAADNRDAIIARQLDCVDHYDSAQPVNWSDVCYMGTRDEHARQVTAALDAIEQPQAEPAIVDNNKNPRSFLDMPEHVKQELNPRHVHKFDLSEEMFYYRYHETIPIDVHGMMVGYNAAYAYRPPDGNFLNNSIANAYMIEYRFATGKPDYKGSGVINDKRNNIWELRGLVGKDFLLGDDSIITPYLGFGFRYLFDDGKDRISSTNRVGYDRTSHYYYLPLGFSAVIPDGRWTNVLNLEYDWFLQGTQYSNLSDVNPYLGGDLYPDLKNKQENGHGVRASYKLMYAYHKVNFYVEPFIRLWKIDDSEIVSEVIGGSGPNSGQIFSGLEPRNWTMELGSKFGLLF